jgi:hypothetical protein
VHNSDILRLNTSEGGSSFVTDFVWDSDKQMVQSINDDPLECHLGDPTEHKGPFLCMVEYSWNGATCILIDVGQRIMGITNHHLNTGVYYVHQHLILRKVSLKLQSSAV